MITMMDVNEVNSDGSGGHMPFLPDDFIEITYQGRRFRRHVYCVDQEQGKVSVYQRRFWKNPIGHLESESYSVDKISFRHLAFPITKERG